MTLLLVLAVLLPWSLWRQMHEHTVTRHGLFKLPLIFTAIGLLDLPHDAALVPAAISLSLSVALGIWRGAVIPAWQDADGWHSRGDRTTITLWIVLIATKFAMGAIGSVTGWFPATGAGEVFLFLGISFAVQNLVVARRTIARPRDLATA
jgi:hypothetical protein